MEATIISNIQMILAGLTEGRIVHYVMPNGEHRPAIVVRVWRELQEASPGYSNLQVFTDFGNDVKVENREFYNDAEIRSGRLWATSVSYADAGESGLHPPHTWHWPERN